MRSPIVFGLLASTVLVAVGPPAKAELLVIGAPLTVAGTNTPTTFTDSVPFQAGTQSIDLGNLSLTTSIDPLVGGGEWVVLHLETTGGPLSGPNSSWEVLYTGLTVGAAAINFDGAFAAFDQNGTNLPPTTAIFAGSGYTVQASPVAQVSGNVQANLGFVDPEGTPGHVFGGLGAVIPVFDELDPTGIPSAAVTGFTLGLRFDPQAPITGAPEPAGYAVLGVGLLGLLAARRRRI